jgi:hypothetical protein
MSTTIDTIVARARTQLLEPTAKFWSDAELLAHGNSAAHDLWKGIIDLYQDHFVTIDTTSMTLSSSTGDVTGVPADLFRVHMVQPRVLGRNSVNQSLIFQPRTLTHPDYVQAQAARPRNPQWNTLYYATINAGAPVAAPAIKVRPFVTSDVPLEVWYIPTLAPMTLNTSTPNPIPGQSDKAIESYIIAFARTKEREDRSPDPEHLSIYATEKRNLLVALTPRSDQEPEVVESFWKDEQSSDGYGSM